MILKLNGLLKKHFSIFNLKKNSTLYQLPNGPVNKNNSEIDEKKNYIKIQGNII